MKLNEINFPKVFEILKMLEQKQKDNNLIIQHRYNDGEWVDSACNREKFEIEEMQLFYFYNDTLEIRIKPSPQYRPYTEVKEEWIGKIIKYFDAHHKITTMITDINEENNTIKCCWSDWIPLKRAFEDFIWGNNGDENDGKPFGEICNEN